MDRNNSDGLWDKFFDTDSQSGTGRFVALIAAFAVLGGGLSWLAS
ncbi:hypothetical protein [Rhizobium halophilum]|nr:hypothetical protein [Rhizobium halophilum]